METNAYISELLQNDSALFSAIYAFNNDILSYAHPDHLAGLPVDVLKSLYASPKSRGEATRYLRQVLQLDEGEYNFEDKRTHLCLLPGESIHKVVCYIGGICFSEYIRKTILGPELVKIRRAIGDDAYTFSLRTAPLFVKSNVAEQFQADGTTMVERMINTGRSLIEMSLAGVSDSLLKRFLLKFPKNYGWNFQRKVDEPAYCFEFVKKVIKRALAPGIAVTMI